MSSSLYRTAVRVREGGGGVEPGLDLRDLQCRKKPYALFGQYAQSKLANVLCAVELNRRERRRAAVAPSRASAAGEEPRRPRPCRLARNAGETSGVGAGGASRNPMPRRDRDDDDDDDGEEKKDDATAHAARTSAEETPETIRKTRRQRLTPASPADAANERKRLEDEDEMGRGCSDIAVGPRLPRLARGAVEGGRGSSRRHGSQTNSSLMSAKESPKIHKKAHRKRLTPASPVDIVNERKLVEDEEDWGLGFSDIAVGTPPPRLARGANEEGRDSRGQRTSVEESPKNNRKARRKRLTPASPADVANEIALVDDEEEAGWGFRDIAVGPRRPRPAEGTARRDTGAQAHSPATSRAERPQTRRRTRLAPPSLADVAHDAALREDEDEDEVGLGFHDIACVGPPRRARPARGAAVAEGRDSRGRASREDSAVTSTGGSPEAKLKVRRQRLTPMSSADSTKEVDETGASVPPEIDKNTEADRNGTEFEDVAGPPMISKPHETENQSNCSTKEAGRLRLAPLLPFDDAAEEEQEKTSLTLNQKTEKTRLKPRDETDHQTTCELLNKHRETEMNTNGTATNTEGPSFCLVRSFCLHPGLVRTNVV